MFLYYYYLCVCVFYVCVCVCVWWGGGGQLQFDYLGGHFRGLFEVNDVQNMNTFGYANISNIFGMHDIPGIK